MIMKKLIYFAAFAMLVAVSCSKNEGPVSSNVEEKLVPITFESGITKTDVSVEGNRAVVNWVEGDEVSLYYWGADGTAKSIVLTATSSGTSTTLTGLIPADDAPDHFYATYPKDKGMLTEEEGVENFTIKISGGDGSFSSANQMAAYTTAEAMNLKFANAVGLIKVPVPSVIRHDGKDYDIIAVRFKDVKSEIPCVGDCKVTVEEGRVTGFTAPSTFNSKATLSQAQIEKGYAYIPVAGGTSTGGFIIQYISRDGEVAAFGDVPAIITKAVNFQVEKGQIKSLFEKEDPTQYIKWDYYVANDGNGDGMSEDAPMSYESFKKMMAGAAEWCRCAALNGTTFHFKNETYNANTNGAIDIPAGAVTFKTTFLGGWGGDAGAKTAWSGASGSSAKAHIFNCNNKIRLYIRDFSFEYGIADNGGAIDLGPKVAPQSDEEFLFDCKDCIFQHNTTNKGGIGGSVLVRAGAKGGVCRFDNCYFFASKAAKNGISIASNGAATVFCNNCSFMEAVPNSICTYIYMSGDGGKLGLNNCSFKTDGSKSGTVVDKTNAIAVHCVGYSVIANSSLWSSAGFGKWGLAGLGCHSINDLSKSGAAIINSVLWNKSTTYNSLYLKEAYFQNVKKSFYSGITLGDKAVEGTNYFLKESWNFSDAGAIDGASVTSGKTSGITYYTLAFNSRPSSSAFSYASKTEVKDAVKAVSVVGEPFDAWLTSLGAYDRDIAGNPRPELMFPGSLQQETSYAE